MSETLTMIEAYKVPAPHLEANYADLAEWCGGSVSSDGENPTIKFETFGGTGEAKPGDYIVKDAQGGFRALTADVFAQAFPASAPAPAPAPEPFQRPAPAPLPAPPAYDPFRR
jgi:hypothetical protein